MIKNIYLYLVLFATLMMIIGGSVTSFMSIADIISPPPYYQSYSDFKELKHLDRVKSHSPTQDGDEALPLNEEELRLEYTELVSQEQKKIKERAINSLIKSMGWIIIPMPIFIFYQRKVKRL